MEIVIIIMIFVLFIGSIVGLVIWQIKKTDPSNIDTSLLTDNTTTQSILSFENIKDSMIHLGNNQYRAVLCCTSINYNLKTEKEQDIIEIAYQRFLNSLSFPISIYIQTKTMDNTKMLESLEEDTLSVINDYPILEEYGKAYFQEMVNIYENIGNNKEKKKYIIIPFDEAGELTSSTDDEKYEYVLQEMRNRILITMDNLENVGITATLLNTPDLIDLLYTSYHKNTANQSENINNEIFLSTIVEGVDRLKDLNEEERLDEILYETQKRLEAELLKKGIKDPNIAKRAELSIKKINEIRKTLAGYFTDNIDFNNL